MKNEKMMKRAFALMAVLSALLGISMQAQAQSVKDCLTTEVGGVSDRLESLIIQTPKVSAKMAGPVQIQTRAVKAAGGEITTAFDCTYQGKETVCVQPDGAGDFLLVEKDGTVFFEAEYLNFALGAISGLPPRKDSDPINEDYAIIFEDSENEETHPDRISLKTKAIECPSSYKTKK
ncbi:MAG: hypothetical protein KF789_13300 [Bdellovibrionaceae bacterium]|nr:hypothetical protein [Pseudobdellovibrionaceae bacterium]